MELDLNKDEKDVGFMTIDSEFETSNHIKNRIEEARNKIIGENYFINICRVLNYPGVEKIDFVKLKNSYHEPRDIFLKNVEDENFHASFFVEIGFTHDATDKQKKTANSHAKKFFSAARGCLIGNNCSYEMKGVNDLKPTTEVTKENYQDFISLAMGDHLRRILVERTSILSSMEPEGIETRKKSATKTL